jgi:hypothetical protein
VKPTIGRIVIYIEPGTRISVPAIVTAVAPKAAYIDLCVFGRYGAQAMSSIYEGPEPGQWHWPPREPPTATPL